MPSRYARRGWLLLPAILLLTGCNAVLLAPAGDLAVRQRDLIIISTGLMLLIILPVIALTLLFAWRYRASNREAVYEPDWDHSTLLELVIWAAPLLIIIALGALTWVSTHKLDPYQSLSRIDARRDVPMGVAPMTVEVVALDWKWLFFYPELGIATVNELAAPVDQPIRFKITASTVMNSFFIPSLAGQVYAMPGMETQLHAVINRPGVYEGFSANYSGAGFSGMYFKFHGMSTEEFERWVRQARAGGGVLTRDAYLQLEKPSELEPVRRYASVAPGLYDAILNRCVEANRPCIKDMMAMSASRGQGKPRSFDVAALEGGAGTRTGAICTAGDPAGIGNGPAAASARVSPR
ncbi:cytochrome O ubiquinol oxidase [Burkholderiaceae bacterium 16]|nr:cytochrome O ubiquinol oxidase [Burkholderiaceae bacterium 16]